ncbi:MAG: hypothetical protein QME96_15850, partial [Myxococcota bacterium]|nr:hypothetical protein [Myxococcota bacterium]
IYRRISVEHPVTRRTIEDRFPIGDETLHQVAERMSIVVLDTPLTHAPKIGDAVVLVRSDRPVRYAEAQGPAACPVCPEPVYPAASACPAVDADHAAVLTAFGSTLGKPLSERVAIWERFLRSNQLSPWAAAVAADVEGLRAMLRESRTGALPGPQSREARVGHKPPTEAYVGEPVGIAVAFDPRDAFRLVQFHGRRVGERAYRTIDMAFDGDQYARLVVPDEFVQVGGFEYHMVAVTPQGVELAIAGNASRPILVTVSERTEEPPAGSGRSQLSTSFEYVDFYYRDLGRDYYLRFETDFRFKIDTWFYALRMGFGIFDGAGGPVDRIDLDWMNPGYREPQPISYRYGFAEIEIRLHDIVYLVSRLSFGSARAYDLGVGFSEAPEALVGALGKIRIGHPDRTNLVLGGGYVEDLGYEAIVSVDLGLLDAVPLRGHIIVTDMPVEADLGVRLVAEGGWRPWSWFEVTAHAGYNIRTINHAGFSLGVGTNFRW